MVQPGLAFTMLLLCIAALCQSAHSTSRDLVITPSATSEIRADGSKSDDKKVLVELFLESTSKDSIFTLQYLDPVISLLHKIVDVRTHYLATGRGPQVNCRLGTEDCVGDIQQLCVQRHAKGPKDNYRVFWQFLQCQGRSASDIGNPELADDCLYDTDVDPKDEADIKRCYSGFEGQGLLRGDSEVTIAAGIDRSATIYVNKEQRCTRNKGKWLRCAGGHARSDFAVSICDAFRHLNRHYPGVCKDLATWGTLDAEDAVEVEAQVQALKADA